ncbi:MFS transporter [Hydrogenibacillus sp. N12]|uniref:MFS transporter n=1 Tax=Hydrogenibacillus sp. N12 TaxID=2866627 RepID=UPI001C7DB3CE|nr:MFS transporter [Hydrogenibacillus sp. N12]QZA32265.1 MFS transporter [Hydrogenibacillus sp. N12]
MSRVVRSLVRLPHGFLEVVLLLFFVEFVRGAFIYAYLPVYGGEVLGLDVGVIGLAITAHSLVDLFGKSLTGFLLDHLPIRVVIGGSMTLALVGLIGAMLVHGPVGLIASVALFGVGISPVWLVGMSRVEEGARSTQMGLLYAFWLVGTGLGMILTNLALDHKLEQPISGIFLIWAAATVWGWMLRGAPGGEGHYRTPSVRAQLAALRQQVVAMRPLVPGMILPTLAAGMLIPILPNFVSRELGFSYTTYSFMLIAGGALAWLGLVPMGRLADHHGKKGFLIGGFLALGLALLAAPSSRSVGMAVALAAILGLGYATILPAWNALLAQYVPREYKGIGWGLFSSIEGIGVLIGPSVGGFLALHTSTAFTVRLAGLALLVIAFYYAVAPIRFEER